MGHKLLRFKSLASKLDWLKFKTRDEAGVRESERGRGRGRGRESTRVGSYLAGVRSDLYAFISNLEEVFLIEIYLDCIRFMFHIGTIYALNPLSMDRKAEENISAHIKYIYMHDQHR